MPTIVDPDTPALARRLLAELLGSAITAGRMFSETFAEIFPASVPEFIVTQLIGGACAVLVIRALSPDLGAAAASDLIVPHPPEGQYVPATDSRS